MNVFPSIVDASGKAAHLEIPMHSDRMLYLVTHRTSNEKIVHGKLSPQDQLAGWQVVNSAQGQLNKAKHPGHPSYSSRVTGVLTWKPEAGDHIIGTLPVQFHFITTFRNTGTLFVEHGVRFTRATYREQMKTPDGVVFVFKARAVGTGRPEHEEADGVRNMVLGGLSNDWRSVLCKHALIATEKELLLEELVEAPEFAPQPTFVPQAN